MGARYREVEIRTATPEMLIVKLYEGLQRFIRRAQKASVEDDYRIRAESISRAVAIVNELQQSLNMEVGGEIATNLDALYTYVTERLVTANVERNDAALQECLTVTKPLLDAWAQIAQNPPERPSMPPAP